MGNVAIIGAGATGVSLFVNLTRASLERTDSITLIDPNPPGRGLAFGDSDPILLCNTSAGIQSIVGGEPSDFLDYCRIQGRSAARADFVPRAWVGNYCANRFADHAWSANRRGVTVHHVRERAVSIIPAASQAGRGYQIRLASGEQVHSSRIVVCPGFTESRVPDGFAAHPRLVLGPYPTADMRDRIRMTGARVLVAGTGLSAVDATLVLCRDGHRVTMASRHGVLPAVRTRILDDPRPYDTLARLRRVPFDDPDLHRKIRQIVTAAVLDIDPLPLRDQVSHATDPVRRLREETELAAFGRCHWQDVYYPLLNILIDWTAGLPQPTRDALMAPFRLFLWRYGASMPVRNARRLLRYVDGGLLRLGTYAPRGVTATVNGFDISGEHYDYVVGAAGFLMPTLYRDRSGIHLDRSAGHGAVPITSLGPDLRLDPGGVWLVGVPTSVRFPFTNFLVSASRQAQHVAAQLALPT